MGTVRLTREQRLVLAVDRLLSVTRDEDSVRRELRELLDGPLAECVDKPVYTALRGAARAWLLTGDNHPQRAQLKAHLRHARDLVRKAQAPMTVAYTGGARPFFERERGS